MSKLEKSYVGFTILCFFFPLVGLILYLVWKDEKPEQAKASGKGALIGVIVEAVFIFIYVLVIVLAVASGIPAIV